METTVTEKTKQLVDKIVKLKKQAKEIKAQSDELVAELHTICERALQDKGVKSTIVYGTGGNSAIVTSPVKVSVVSFEKLIEAFGEKMINEYAPLKVVQPERKASEDFTRVLADVVLGNYLEGDLGIFFDETFKPTPEQRAILLKKLKGVYDKDRKVLCDVFGDGDYDVEQYHISRIMNYKRICLHLPGDLVAAIEAIKSAVAVDENISTEVAYKKE